jgi:hypothetical protein
MEQQECSGPHFLKLLNHLGQANCSVSFFSNSMLSFKKNDNHN